MSRWKAGYGLGLVSLQRCAFLDRMFLFSVILILSIEPQNLPYFLSSTQKFDSSPSPYYFLNLGWNIKSNITAKRCIVHRGKRTKRVPIYMYIHRHELSYHVSRNRIPYHLNPNVKTRQPWISSHLSDTRTWDILFPIPSPMITLKVSPFSYCSVHNGSNTRFFLHLGNSNRLDATVWILRTCSKLPLFDNEHPRSKIFLKLARLLWMLQPVFIPSQGIGLIFWVYQSKKGHARISQNAPEIPGRRDRKYGLDPPLRSIIF